MEASRLLLMRIGRCQRTPHWSDPAYSLRSGTQHRPERCDGPLSAWPQAAKTKPRGVAPHLQFGLGLAGMSGGMSRDTGLFRRTRPSRE